jgi:serine protease
MRFIREIGYESIGKVDIILLQYLYECFNNKIISFSKRFIPKNILFLSGNKVKKYKYLFLLVLVLSASQLFAQYHSNKLYVKFKEGYHNTDNELFKGILGDHIVKPLISEGLLALIKRKYDQNSGIMLKQSSLHNKAMNIYHKISELERIYLIEYENRIAPQIAARKLSSISEIEYAEPVPIHNFSYVPNDPRKKEQYYLQTIQCFEAWDILEDPDTVVVGIVDTGIDYTHEDLSANIFINYNETGMDEEGNDKSSNGIDDDGNGFIDDWRGWDFVSSESADGDNDPMPGHIHGTHVGGTVGAVVDNEIGIAGICRYVKLMPVKVGSDDPQSLSVSRGYDGILYAAAMGADVINCSWGSYSPSTAEKEIIDLATSLGSVIVAAAGNEGQNSEQYPASFGGVMSVAALDIDDERAYFSNYHRTVDVSAPGYEIYATVPGNWYNYLNGTSMASPIAAGVAALVIQKHPEYTPLQVIEHVKQSCDDIYTINEGFEGLLGSGRVNAFKAMTIENPRSVILLDHLIKDENNDMAYDAGEVITVDLTFLNVLSPINSVKVKARETSFGGIDFPE